MSAVIPLVLDKLDLDDAELRPAREASANALAQIVEAAHRDGSLPEEVTFADIGMLLVRLARPLPGPTTVEPNDALVALAPRPADRRPPPKTQAGQVSARTSLLTATT